MKIIASIQQPALIEKMLAHLKNDSPAALGRLHSLDDILSIGLLFCLSAVYFDRWNYGAQFWLLDNIPGVPAQFDGI